MWNPTGYPSHRGEGEPALPAEGEVQNCRSPSEVGRVGLSPGWFTKLPGMDLDAWAGPRPSTSIAVLYTCNRTYVFMYMYQSKTRAVTL